MSSSATAQVPPAPETLATRARPRRGVGPLALAGGLLAALAIIAVLFFLTRGQPEAFHGGEYSPPLPAPALNLTDQAGNAFSLAEQQGDVVLLYFGYTTCPDLCPTTLLDYQAVKEELGEDAGRVRFVLVTFDPERDTEARLKEYLAFFDPEFIGLRGDEAQTEAFLRDYGVVVSRVEYPDSATGYLLDHTALIYVVDPEGRLRLTFPYGTDPALIAQDIQRLLHG